MNEDGDLFVGFLFGALISGLITAGIVVSITRTNCRNAAIDAGVAEWRIDAKTGEREFVYLTPEVER